MSSHIEQIRKKYGWPLVIHSRGHDAYLVGFQPLAGDPVPIYRWPGGDSIADSRELDCDVEMFHHLEELLKKKPASLYEQNEIFKAYPLWYKDLALYAMECVSSRQGPDQFTHELLQAPAPADEWATEYDLNERPNVFPIAEQIGTAENRDAVISRFGVWLEEHQLGHLDGEMFTINAQAADRYFEGRYTAFQNAVSDLQMLNGTQFIHDHDWVQALIDKLSERFTSKRGDYIMWDDDIPVPFEEFLRKAQPSQQYYFGAVLAYK